MLIDAHSTTEETPPQPSYTCAMERARLITGNLMLCAILVPASIAAQDSSLHPASNRQFEVVAIKQSAPDQHGSSWNGRSDRITISNYTLRHLIRVAYDLKSDKQILGGPDWIDKSHFDIAAKLEDADATSIYKLPYEESHEQVMLIFQRLLADRFQLKLHQDQQTLPAYSLEVAKSGAKITPISEPNDHNEAKNLNHGTSTNNGHLVTQAISMDRFADYLTEFTESGDRVVVNRTGLAGEFDFTLNWARDYGNGIPSDAQFPGLFTALQEQLGLTLKSDKASVPVVVIEAASLPQLD